MNIKCKSTLEKLENILRVKNHSCKTINTYGVDDFLKAFGCDVEFELMRITSNDITTAEFIHYSGYGKIKGVKEDSILVVGKAGYGDTKTNFHDWIPIDIVTKITEI